MRNIFIDSDVVIDYFTDREPHVNPASELFELSEKGLIKLYISAVSVNNIYYIVRKYLGHRKTIDIIKELIDMTQVIGTTKNEIVQALENNFSDFEDSIQYSSALTVKGIDVIVTRNVKDYRKSIISVMTPLNFLKMRGLT